MLFFRPLLLALLMPIWLLAAQKQVQTPSVEPTLSEEEKVQFLLTAKVIKSRLASKGITRPYRLTLSDGRLTHDAGFQCIDVYKSVMKLDDGTTQIGFRDSYHFNIAAYHLAKLLGLEYMMPVTVQRKWEGKTGSLTWWLKVKMDENERLRKHIPPPDIEAWDRQMYRKRVFAELVYDADPNATNVLIGEDWDIYMIDFSRAFRLHEKLLNPENIDHCDRQLLERLRQLDRAEIERATSPHLTRSEIKALLIRRDMILDRVEQLIKEKGEEEVLY